MSQNGLRFVVLTEVKQFFYLASRLRLCTYTNSINDCNTSLGKDAIHRVFTNSLFVAFFFQIDINSLEIFCKYKVLLSKLRLGISCQQWRQNQ